MNESTTPQIYNMELLSTKGTDAQSVETFTSVERFERMQKAAAEIGGFSVSQVAGAGELYTNTYEDPKTGKINTTSPKKIPEGKVIISMTNTGNPDTPTAMDALYPAIGE